MNSKLRKQAIELRLKNELSYSEIKKRLNVPKSTLSYWLRDFPLSKSKILELRRKGWAKGEASRELFRETMRQKREEKAQNIYRKYQKEFFNISNKTFFISGLMLYLGEGDKHYGSRIVLANTDSRIIKFFIKWLNNFLNVPKNEIKAQLHLYENMDIEKEQKFWQNELKLSKIHFYKSMIRKLKKSSFSYAESYRHGTCSIYVMGVERKTKIMMAIRAFLDHYTKVV